MTTTTDTMPWVCGDCLERFTVHSEFIAHKYLTHWQQESVERIRELRRLKAVNVQLLAACEAGLNKMPVAKYNKTARDAMRAAIAAAREGKP